MADDILMFLLMCMHVCASLCCVCTGMCLCEWVVSAQLCEEFYSQEPRMVILMPSLPSTSDAHTHMHVCVLFMRFTVCAH